jgi:hypothetical protein
MLDAAQHFQQAAVYRRRIIHDQELHCGHPCTYTGEVTAGDRVSVSAERASMPSGED